MRSFPGEGGLTGRAAARLFAALTLGTVLFDASHAWFWQRRHDMAPVAGLLLAIFAVALLRRHRWAWWIFLLISVGGLPSWAFDTRRHLTVGAVLGLIVGLLELGLLLSSPMRQYVGIGQWRRREPLPAAQPDGLPSRFRS